MSDETTPGPQPTPEPTPPTPPRTTPPAYYGRRPRRRGYLFPLILIAIGVLFLLGNLGYLPPITWQALLSLWPVLLIVFGVEMLVGRRRPLLALALEAAVVAAAVALVAAQPFGFFGSPVTVATSFSIPRGGSRALSLNVQGGAGTYTISGGAADLVDASSSGGAISVHDERHGGTADVSVQPTNFGGNAFGVPGTVPSSVDVRVASDVPTSLRVSGGAGEFTVDLGRFEVRTVRIDTGASRLDLTLPTPSGDVPIRIGAGAASLTIVVPDGVEAAITTQGGLVSTTILNPRFGSGTSSSVARSATTLQTSGYASAKDRVTVTLSAGASSVTIR